MKCRICQEESKKVLIAKILNKYDVAYYLCPQCDALQTELPYWLEESYRKSINDTDIGILRRNIVIAKITTSIIFFAFNSKKKFLDYAGGYGIFTRLMRDVGFDFFWDDPYTENLFATGFNKIHQSEKYELLTSFESLEHFINPIDKLNNMFSMTDNIIFSTELKPSQVPSTDSWDYYGLHHGQHIIFYSKKTFRYIAGKFNVKYYNFSNIHVFTKRRNIFLSIFPKGKLGKILLFGVSFLPKLFLKSKLFEDHKYLLELLHKKDAN